MSGNIEINGHLFEPFLPEERIAERVCELGAAINKDYREKRPIFIGVLDSTFMFAADLCRQICITTGVEGICPVCTG